MEHHWIPLDSRLETSLDFFVRPPCHFFQPENHLKFSYAGPESLSNLIEDFIDTPLEIAPVQVQGNRVAILQALEYFRQEIIYLDVCQPEISNIYLESF